MAINLSDIEFFLSGGSTNSDPNKSLGGAPSGFLVLGSANNLFSDLSSDEAVAGKTDYRCFYICNGSTYNKLYDAEIYFEDQGVGGSAVALGIANSTEIQTMTILGPVYFGSLTLNYGSSELIALWGTSAAEFKTSLQSQLASIVPGVVVETTTQGNKYSFKILFQGESDNRSHPLLEVVNNGLLAPDTPIVSISKTTAGGPINSIAPAISVDIVPPSKVSFYETSESSKLSLGTLKPGDKVPVWIKRVTLAGADYLERDYFKFAIIGRPF